MSVDTKTALLNSAEHAARMRGFDGFSYADLARDVGITKASIHHHFASKADLAVALMQRYYADLERACAQIEQDHATGALRLAAFIELYRGALKGGTHLCLCVSFSTSADTLPQDTIAEMNRFRSMMLDWLTGIFAAGQADGTIADVRLPEHDASVSRTCPSPDTLSPP